MKCDCAFVLAYNNLFKYLEENVPSDRIDQFWSLLESAILGRLRYLVSTKGFAGMAEYWSETLSFEGAEFEILLRYTEDNKSFFITLFDCPSLRKIRESGNEVAGIYCSHCMNIYPMALKPLGYEFKLTKSRQGCSIMITKCRKKTD